MVCGVDAITALIGCAPGKGGACIICDCARPGSDTTNRAAKLTDIMFRFVGISYSFFCTSTGTAPSPAGVTITYLRFGDGVDTETAFRIGPIA